jgi:hypothetical protein
MVNLKLEVRVFPRQHVSGREDPSPQKEYVSFWLPLRTPEQTSFGELAAIIADEWRDIKPGEE